MGFFQHEKALVHEEAKIGDDTRVWANTNIQKGSVIGSGCNICDGSFVEGGWDTWAAWNLKAKFLFFGGTNWDNIFDPVLWRSSPHYPLLLPMMTTWGWTFVNEATYLIPIFNSIFFSFLTAGLLFSGLKRLTNTWLSIIPAVFFVSLPFFQKLSTSQYCDLYLGYYLLGSLTCIVIAKTEQERSFSFLSGIFLGFLSFTKGEGLLAAAIIIGLSVPYLAWKNNAGQSKRLLISFFSGVGISFIPTIFFKLVYCPASTTFTNGLLSSSDPITFLRFKTIMAFYFFEFFPLIWNAIVFFKENTSPQDYVELKIRGIWIVMFLGLIMSWKRCFNLKIFIVGAFFILYNLVIIAFYMINLHWKIDWWLQVSLHRILIALLPTFIFWSFYSLWCEK